LFTLYGTSFPAYRALMILVALLMLLILHLGLTRSRIGLLIQAALTHPQMVQALGHNLPRIQMFVFGSGCALAGLAGVLGGNAYVTEPGMAATLGSILFVVVVVGGLGSLRGALLASLFIGILQTFAVTVDSTIADLLGAAGIHLADVDGLLAIRISRLAPVLPYLLLITMLLFRPMGLSGRREG
jgi:branched-chain amino acid transport system permease protein